LNESAFLVLIYCNVEVAKRKEKSCEESKAKTIAVSGVFFFSLDAVRAVIACKAWLISQRRQRHH
jgi:hypothetical protein